MNVNSFFRVIVRRKKILSTSFTGIVNADCCTAVWLPPLLFFSNNKTLVEKITMSYLQLRHVLQTSWHQIMNIRFEGFEAHMNSVHKKNIISSVLGCMFWMWFNFHLITDSLPHCLNRISIIQYLVSRLQKSHSSPCVFDIPCSSPPPPPNGLSSNGCPHLYPAHM